jgi:predicted nucleotidyltransferase
LDKRRTDKIIKFLTEKLIEDGVNVYKVVLFGSYKYGMPNRDSDIDIAVISNDFKKKNIFELGPMTGNAVRATMRKFDIPIDLIKLTVDEYENETRMIASYVKEGKVVYAK